MNHVTIFQTVCCIYEISDMCQLLCLHLLNLQLLNLPSWLHTLWLAVVISIKTTVVLVVQFILLLQWWNLSLPFRKFSCSRQKTSTRKINLEFSWIQLDGFFFFFSFSQWKKLTCYPDSSNIKMSSVSKCAVWILPWHYKFF